MTRLLRPSRDAIEIRKGRPHGMTNVAMRRASALAAAFLAASCGGGSSSSSDGANASGAGGGDDSGVDGVAGFTVAEGGTGCAGDACVCTPGTASCANGKATACRQDGSGIIDFDCDPVQGMTCDPDGCKGQCSPGELFASYIGCDYFPTVTLNPVWSGFDFAVAVGNTTMQAANVTVTRGATSVDSRMVAAGSLEVFKLPWVPELKGGDADACQIPARSGGLAPGDRGGIPGAQQRARDRLPIEPAHVRDRPAAGHVSRRHRVPGRQGGAVQVLFE